jgi:hypothetical protein
MIHIHGTVVDPRGHRRFEDIDVYIASHALPDGRCGWLGYFEPPTARGMSYGSSYRLILNDGRAGDILIQAIRSRGQQAPRVLFSAESPLR